ncbi:transposase [Corynebacterium macginleyi]|uniref:transposase n=1 Tax=Corynebacterium macginleyi TaxID=38290 RepID=UPI001F222112|nr:transposase [Corynebacterium macginleyi]
MSTLIDTFVGMKDAGIAEIARLGRTMNKPREDILAYFDHGVSNAPVESINGRLEFLRGIAPRLPQPQPLHLAMPHPRRQHPTQNQRTLKPEEPVNPAQHTTGSHKPQPHSPRKFIA